MLLSVCVDRDIVIMSNFGTLMNDPRYGDAGRETSELLDQGFNKFILDLGGVRETGSSFFALLLTMTRRIRQDGGEAVIANASPNVEKVLDKMRLDEYWDIFKTMKEASEFFGSEPD